jgi:hypothetical protein
MKARFCTTYFNGWLFYVGSLVLSVVFTLTYVQLLSHPKNPCTHPPADGYLEIVLDDYLALVLFSTIPTWK